ncbi:MULTISPECIES: hypothetical protein [Streptomyces]|uniref:hypothetical protein n=1 Tax=Streptomyces TaxID=1883 RepID=UPI00167B104B|nr:hypothetical protein [Streptomyces canarius]
MDQLPEAHSPPVTAVVQTLPTADGAESRVVAASPGVAEVCQGIDAGKKIEGHLQPRRSAGRRW